MKKIFLFIALGAGLCACSDETQLRDPDVVEEIEVEVLYICTDSI